MNLKDQVLAQALLLAGDMPEKQMQILNALCTATTASLQARLREGLTADDCKADFVAAASLLALAAMGTVEDADRMEQITAGDFTIRKTGRDAASNCLRAQAELMISPYLKDKFDFRGV